MSKMLNRRALLGGLAALPLAPLAFAATVPLTTTHITNKLSLISGAGGNVVVLAGEDGQLLVDGGARDATRALQAQLKRLPGGGRVHTLFNTHWHAEQTGGNEVFAKSGAQIIAQEKTRLWLSTDHYQPDADRYEKALPRGAWPSKSFYTVGEMPAGPERIAYGHLLEAHTAGDLYVHFLDSNVLAVGDALSPLRDPQLDWVAGGWLGGRVDALALLLKRGNEQTRFVPSWGPVVGRAEVQAEHDLMLTLYGRFTELMRKGYTTQAMLEGGILDKLPRTLENPGRFVYDVHKGMWAHHNTLSHDIV